ncbi:MAG: RNA 3'-terminal phosphate cyclase [Thermoguttaceae bacterium]|jgi:RNA 3'-terminal phosphate cyclase (ATP)
MADIVTIDGSRGEGGGQVLRSSLALSLVTGRPFTIENIRAGRKKPGLLRQHLTAVLAAAEVGGADADGAALGSPRLVFRPGPIRSGNYSFRVGTAGSATLVLQTVLPALLLAEGESNLVLEGGTHNPMAPPVDFLEKAYLPLVNRLGPHVDVQLVRPGFYPAGGGEFTVRVQPAMKLGRLDLVDRGEITARRVRALVARLPRHIAERECRTIAQETGWDESSFSIDEVKGCRGPGNVVMIELEAEHVTEVFTAFGQLGVRAEDVAKEALRQAAEYLVAGVPVGKYLADQLMLPLGIGAYLSSDGGVFRTMDLSLHTSTHMEILRRFLEIDVQIEQCGPGDRLVRIG